MFFPGAPNIFVPDDSVFMLLKCMHNNILIEKKSGGTMEHWQVLPATIVGWAENFLNSIHSRMTKTITF